MKEIKLTGASLTWPSLFCVDSLQGCRLLRPALKSYTLASVYESLLRMKPSSSHKAEADCFNLLQITEMMEEWIPWAEENMVKFSDIQPMY